MGVCVYTKNKVQDDTEKKKHVVKSRFSKFEKIVDNKSKDNWKSERYTNKILSNEQDIIDKNFLNIKNIIPGKMRSRKSLY